MIAGVAPSSSGTPAPEPAELAPPGPEPTEPEPSAPEPVDLEPEAPEPDNPEPDDPEPDDPKPDDPEPPAPDPPEPPPTPNGLGIEFAPSVSSSEIRLTWNAVPEATYVVELGDAPGSENLGNFDVNNPSFVFGDLPPGRVFARVRARNGDVVSPPSVEVSEWFFDMKDYVEAVFLGTGRLTPTDGNHGCSATGWVRGFARGTTVPLSVSTTVSSAKAATIQGVANQVSQATAGALQVIFDETTDPNPIPGEDEATSTTHPSPASEGCGGNGGRRLSAALQPRGMPQLLSTLRLSGHHTVMKSALVAPYNRATKPPRRTGTMPSDTEFSDSVTSTATSLVERSCR